MLSCWAKVPLSCSPVPLVTSACSKLRANASTRPMRPCRRQGPLLALMHLCQEVSRIGKHQNNSSWKHVRTVQNYDIYIYIVKFLNIIWVCDESNMNPAQNRSLQISRLLCRCLARISTTGSLSRPPVSSGIETMTLSMDTCSLADK